VNNKGKAVDLKFDDLLREFQLVDAIRIWKNIGGDIDLLNLSSWDWLKILSHLPYGDSLKNIALLKLAQFEKTPVEWAKLYADFDEDICVEGEIFILSKIFTASSIEEWVEICRLPHRYLKTIALLRLSKFNLSLEEWVRFYYDYSATPELEKLALFKISEFEQTFEEWLGLFDKVGNLSGSRIENLVFLKMLETAGKLEDWKLLYNAADEMDCAIVKKVILSKMAD